MAAVYADVILSGGSWDCEACGHSDAEWTRRGRCTAPIKDGVEQLPVVIQEKGHDRTTVHVYPAEFDQCPRALLRDDVYPEETAIAGLVTQAVRANVTSRWPDVPARLWSLAVLCDDAQKMRQNACLHATSNPDGVG
jgi:hypothetical protein